MGYSYSSDEGPVMCFNGPKNWQLGWYSDRHLTVSPDYSWSGRIYGIASYGVTSSNEKMIIRMDDPSNSAGDIYISYNAKIGVNAGSLEGGNQVLVHSKVADVNSYGQSWLLHKMSTGVTQNVAINGQSIPITVVAINTGAAVPYADIQIGTLNPTEAPTDSPTNNPTKSPTRSPTKAPSPTTSPTKNPTKSPTRSPTKSPTNAPVPTSSPTKAPTIDCASQSKSTCSNYSQCEWWGKFKVCRSVSGPSPSPPSPTPPTGDCAGLNKSQCQAAGCSWSNRFKICS